MKFYKTRAKTIKINKEKLFWLAVLSIFLLVVLYFYALNAAAFNAAKVTRIEKEMHILNQSIGSLEFELIAAKNKLNLDLAYSMGFEEAQDVKFIQRKSVATILGIGSIQ